MLQFRSFSVFLFKAAITSSIPAGLSPSKYPVNATCFDVSIFVPSVVLAEVVPAVAPAVVEEAVLWHPAKDVVAISNDNVNATSLANFFNLNALQLILYDNRLSGIIL